MRTWEYPISDPDWPDHKIQFYIDFPDTPSTADDQKFEGYLFSHDRSTMAGLTWWNGTPFGFYARQNNASPDEMGLEFERSPAVLAKTDFLGTYFIEYDGWQAILRLWTLPDNFASSLPNIGGYLMFMNGDKHNLRGFVRTATYPLSVSWGPDHQIEFYVDFNHTSGNPADDQKFLGYLFTQTKKAMAGLTWWQGTPFGFLAEKAQQTYLPVLRR
jgi:hypothetical protein